MNGTETVETTPAATPLTFEDPGLEQDFNDLSMFDAKPERVEGTAQPKGNEQPSSQPNASVQVPGQANNSPNPAVPSTPAATPQQQQAVVDPTQQQQAAQPGQQPGQQPAAPPQDPATRRAELRTRTMAQLEANFAVSEEDSAELMAGNFNKVLPKAMANLAMTTFEHTLASIMNQLPDWIRMVVEQDRGNTQFWDKFFTDNSGLASRRNEVYQLFNAYRQVNPQMPVDQLMKEIALIAGARFNIAPSTAQPGTEVHVQTQQPKPSPVAQAQRPHLPAAPHSVGVPPSNVNDNPWSDLLNEFNIAEERDH